MKLFEKLATRYLKKLGYRFEAGHIVKQDWLCNVEQIRYELVPIHAEVAIIERDSNSIIDREEYAKQALIKELVTRLAPFYEYEQYPSPHKMTYFKRVTLLVAKRRT